MTVENLINIVRLGRQLTPAQSRAVSAQLERIPAMERTLASKDKGLYENRYGSRHGGLLGGV